jgi:hypothetical protein
MESKKEIAEAAKNLPQRTEKLEKSEVSIALKKNTGATGLKSDSANKALLIAMTDATLPVDASKEDTLNLFFEMGDLVRQFSPQDPIEAMLVSQIVALQKAGLKTLARATRQSENHRWASTCFNGASKLFARAQSAIGLLMQHRRGAQQVCRVEHIHVEQGGTAAFGHFEAKQGGPSHNQSNFDQGSL